MILKQGILSGLINLVGNNIQCRNKFIKPSQCDIILQNRTDTNIEMYSLQNLPQLSKGANVKLTPRSNEAFKRKGYTIEMIVKKTPEEINAQFGDHIKNQHIIEKRFLHAEERRQAKLDSLKQLRRQIIIEEENGNWNPLKSANNNKMGLTKSTTNSAMIEKQLKNLEKMRLKQQRQIQQTINYESQMQIIRQKNLSKMKSDKEREEERREEFAQKRKLEEEKKNARDKKLKEKQERQAQIKERIKQEARIKEELQKEEERRRIQEQNEKLAKSQQQRKQKREQAEKLKAERLRQQQEENKKKRKQMQEKQQQRLKFIEQANQKKRQESENKRKEKEEKLKQVKANYEQSILNLQKQSEQKEQILKIKMSQFQQQKQKIKAERMQESIKKMQKIKEIIQNNQKMEQTKKQTLLRKQQQAEQRKLQKQKQLEQQLEQKRNNQIAKQEERRKKKERYEMMQKQHKENIETVIRQKEENLMRIRQEKSQQMLEKHNEDNIKRRDKIENVSNILRSKEYERELLMHKINQKMERADRIKQQRQQLLEKKAHMKKQIEMQKHTIQQKIEKLKQGKISPEQLLKTISTQQSHLNTSFTESRLKSPSPKMPKQRTTTNHHLIRSKIEEEPKQNLKQNAIEQEVRHTAKTEKKRPILVERENNVSRVELNQLLERQNKEMLKILVAEQEADNRREEALKAAPKQQRGKLMKDISIQRSKVNNKIQRLEEKHKRQLQLAQGIRA